MKYFDDLYVSGNIFTDSEKVAIEKEVIELEASLSSTIDQTKNEFCVKIEEVEQSISTLRNEVFEGDGSLKASLDGLDSKVEEHVSSSAERFNTIEENLSNEVLRAETEEQRISAEVNTVKQSVSNLREELLGENESLKTILEEKDEELEGSINFLSEKVEAEITRATEAEEDLQGQITADVEALTTHKNDDQNPHKVTLSQLVENGAEAIIPAGEVNNYCTLKIKAEDINRRGNDYVLEISPEQLSLYSGNSKLVFSDGEIGFTSVVSGIAGKNDDEFIVKSQLDNQFCVLDSKIDTTKSDLEDSIKEAISAETHFDFLVTPTLPETGVKGIIYLVNKSSSAEDQNFYEEYIWSGNGYEKIGDTRVDLEPYAKTEEVSSAIEASINKEVSDRNDAIEEAINNEISNRNTAIAAEKALIETAYKDADTLLGSGLENKIKTVSDALIEESNARSSKDSELSESIATLKALTDKHIEDFETKVNEVDTRVGLNEASISSISIDLSSVKGTIESLTAKDTSIEANLFNLSLSVNTNTAAISALNGTVETKAEELKVVKTSLSTLNGTVESHTEAIDESKKDITDLKSFVKTYIVGEGDEEGLLRDVAVLEEKVSNLEKADLSNRVTSNETAIATINATIPTLATKTELEKELENKASVEYVDNTLAESKAYTDSEIEKIKKSNKYVEKFDVGASSDPSVSITLNHNIGENDCCVVQVYKNTTRGKELSSCDILIGDDGTITLTFYNVTENSSFTVIVMS